jgi:uncharacterized integral membrane protein
MPWKLIGFLILMTVLVLFAGFNLSNVSDISFGLFTLHQVPVFFSLYVAFLFGALVALIGVLASRGRSQKFTPTEEPPLKPKRGKKHEQDTTM